MTDLYVRYQRLLVVYPREYRRRRGEEIATTYTEMAAEGQRWPRGRDAASLLRHGLRARLGRPRSRLVVPLAVLAMLVGGLCAAAAGARAGWGGSTGLNARQQAEINRLATAAQATFTTTTGSGDGTPAWLNGYLSMPAWGKSPQIIESTGHVPSGGPTPRWPGPDPRELVAEERTRLAGSGWTVTGQTATDAAATMTIRSGDLVARLDASSGWTEYIYTIGADQAASGGRGDCVLRLGSEPGSTTTYTSPCASTLRAGPDGFAASVYRVTPGAVPVLAVLAGLLGAVATYLLVGWLNRRAAGLAVWGRRTVSAGLAATVVLAVPAAAVCAAGVWTALRDRADVPIRYWGGFVTGEVRIAALAAAGVLVATVVGAALIRPARPAAEVAR